MYLKYLTSFLIILIVCVYGSTLEPGESRRSRVTEHGAWVIGRQEERLASAEIKKYSNHAKSSSDKSFLNPAKVVHNIKARKAYSNAKVHTENANQLVLAQRTTGVVKVTRSKSGNKNHYEAVRF